MSEAKELVNLTRMKHFSHDHLLELIKVHMNVSGELFNCSGCWDPIVGSSYCCIDCKFYLHKTCTNLPLNINHSSHQHTLNLHNNSTYPSRFLKPFCAICYNTKGFFYHCYPCGFDLDVKCAFSPHQFIAADFSKFQHSSHEHPLILIDQRPNNQLKPFACAACDEPTSGPIYKCTYCRPYYLHKKCLELPPEITHPSHHKHPLTLLTNPPLHHEGCSCYLCKNPCKGFIYHCAICEFGIKIKHVFSSQFENGNHQHPFFLLPRPISFICDACGTDGDCISYICTTCNLVVHKECFWLPHMIKIPRHVHQISHVYCLPDKENKLWECKICYNEVKSEYGSYYCSLCNYIVHVNCVREITNGTLLLFESTKDELNKETMGLVPNDVSGCSAEDVTDTEIKHIDHEHNLIFSVEMVDEAYCDGCMRTISGPFYSCKPCDFFLHEACAKLPLETYFLFAPGKFLLQKYSIFRCLICNFWVTGLSYMCNMFEFEFSLCLGCCAITDILTHEGHDQHPIFFDEKYKGKCTACGGDMGKAFRCKKNDFALDLQCLQLPLTTRHKSDKHPLKLTYHDSDYPSQHYCDICEEERNPAYWFYSCAYCNFTAHPKCTLGNHPFINQGFSATFECHPHPLVTRKRVYNYPPNCKECHKPCLDLALECTEPGCNYIMHWDCSLD